MTKFHRGEPLLAVPDYLTCMEVFRRLDDYVDRELSPVEMALVSAHLAACSLCAREMRFEKGLLDEVRRKLKKVDLPPGLREKISERLR